jgi:UDP-glucose 4-epimerase
MSRAVLIGGSGFIGQNLVRNLRGRIETVVYDLRDPPLEKPDLYVAGDLDDTGKIGGLVQAGDVVFHLVHSTTPAESDLAPGEDVSTNLFQLMRLVEVLVQRKIDRLIYSSSGGTVYGDTDEIPIPESAPLRPGTSYGIVKMLMEKYLQIFQHRERLDYVIMRISNPYGPYQEMSNRHGAVPAIMRALKNSEPFTIYGDGETVRDYIYIDDVGSALLGILESKARNGIFNIGTGKGTSLNQLILEIERVSGLRLERIYKPIRGSDLRLNVLDPSSIQGLLDWKPAIPLPQGLQQTWEYWCGLERY